MYFNHSRMLCSFLPLCAQVARIETEKLLLQLLETELGRRAKEGAFSGKFAGLTHYFGYEGRCSMPTNFDAS